MASQYDSIKTAEELLKEVAAHGLSIKPCQRRGSASEDAGGARRIAVCGPYARLDPRRRR